MVTAINRAIKLAKGQVRLREALRKQGVEVTQQAISGWKLQGYAPKNRHSAVAKAVGYRVRVAELKADVLRARQKPTLDH